MLYNHTQGSYFLTLLMLLPLGLVTGIFWFKGEQIGASFEAQVLMVGVFLFGLLISLMFCALTVTVDQGVLRVSFRYGLIKKSFQISEIESATAVTNPWYFGWGIHYNIFSRTMIINIAGSRAVELVFRNGKRIRIGTDEPEQLESVLRTIVVPVSNSKTPAHTKNEDDGGYQLFK